MMPESHHVHRGPSYHIPYVAASAHGDPTSRGVYGGYGGMHPGGYGASVGHLPAVGGGVGAGASAGGAGASEAHNLAVSAGWRTASLPEDG